MRLVLQQVGRIIDPTQPPKSVTSKISNDTRGYKPSPPKVVDKIQPPVSTGGEDKHFNKVRPSAKGGAGGRQKSECNRHLIGNKQKPMAVIPVFLFNHTK